MLGWRITDNDDVFATRLKRTHTLLWLYIIVLFVWLAGALSLRFGVLLRCVAVSFYAASSVVVVVVVVLCHATSARTCKRMRIVGFMGFRLKSI